MHVFLAELPDKCITSYFFQRCTTLLFRDPLLPEFLAHVEGYHRLYSGTDQSIVVINEEMNMEKSGNSKKIRSLNVCYLCIVITLMYWHKKTESGGSVMTNLPLGKRSTAFYKEFALSQ